MKKILNFIDSKNFGYFTKTLMIVTILFMTLFKEELTNNDLGSLILFSMIYLGEEIKFRTDYYEKKEQEDDQQKS
jgi:hypothetical protein